MNILIEYHEKQIVAKVIGDHKVSVMLVSLDEEQCFVELDQCKNCGVWRSEDEELYGDGYCGGCCSMCIECQQYKPEEEMHPDITELCISCNSDNEDSIRNIDK